MHFHTQSDQHTVHVNVAMQFYVLLLSGLSTVMILLNTHIHCIHVVVNRIDCNRTQMCLTSQ